METIPLSPAAEAALRIIRALKRLPESHPVRCAIKRATKNLSCVDVTAVALALDAENGGVR